MNTTRCGPSAVLATSSGPSRGGAGRDRLGHRAGDHGRVVSVAYTGQRYATSAQCAWAHRWAADAADLLIGTVDRHNHASRAAAVRAGRPRVLDDIFVALDSSTPVPRSPSVQPVGDEGCSVLSR